MDAVHVALRRLRTGFVVWFGVQAVLGTAVAVLVIEGLRRHPMLGAAMRGATWEITVTSGFVASVLLFALAMLVFVALLDLKRWARLLLLVVGWITAAGALLSLLGLSGSAALADSVLDLSSSDWAAVQAGTVVTKAIDLAFWSWLFYTLQMNPAVRDAFRHAAGGCAPAARHP